MVYSLGKQPGVGELSVRLWTISLDAHGHRPDAGTLWKASTFTPTAGVNLTFNLICRRIVADAAVRLHDAGIHHGLLCLGKEHHILYHEDTKRVNLVGFTESAAGHYCHPSNTKPDKVASSKKLCGAVNVVADILDLWYHDRLLSMFSLIVNCLAGHSTLTYQILMKRTIPQSKSRLDFK